MLQSYRTELANAVVPMLGRTLGHILRSDENTAAQQLSLTFAVEVDKHLTGCIGRPRSNLFTLIRTI